jgi:hypothetical protein
MLLRLHIEGSSTPKLLAGGVLAAPLHRLALKTQAPRRTRGFRPAFERPLLHRCWPLTLHYAQ